MEQFISHNGYLTVLIGITLGGEIGLFAGVALAHTGSISLAGVVVLGTAASFIANTFYYYAGRLLWHKWSWLRLKFGERVEKTSSGVRHYGSLIMLVARFFYGIRDIVPITLGLYEVGAGTFAVYNAIGAFVWAFFFTVVGHFFAEFVQSSFRSFQAGLVLGVAATIVAMVLYFLIRRGTARMRDRSES